MEIVSKSKISSDYFNWNKSVIIKSRLNNQRITRGLIDNKRHFFLETISCGRMVESVTFTSLAALKKMV